MLISNSSSDCKPFLNLLNCMHSAWIWTLVMCFNHFNRFFLILSVCDETNFISEAHVKRFKLYSTQQKCIPLISRSARLVLEPPALEALTRYSSWSSPKAFLTIRVYLLPSDEISYLSLSKISLLPLYLFNNLKYFLSFVM